MRTDVRICPVLEGSPFLEGDPGLLSPLPSRNNCIIVISNITTMKLGFSPVGSWQCPAQIPLSPIPDWNPMTGDLFCLQG